MLTISNIKYRKYTMFSLVAFGEQFEQLFGYYKEQSMFASEKS